MSPRTIARTEKMPSIFNDFFRPWNEWFEGGLTNRVLNVPAVNITENKDEYMLALAIPGMKKEDFNIDIEGNMLTISSEKEESKEEKDEKYTRKEFNYSSFSRSFSLPDEVNMDKIDARYMDGVLRLSLPKKEEAKKIATSKHIPIK